MPKPPPERFVEMMSEIGRTLDKIFNDDRTGADRDIGFVLLAFPLDTLDGATATYVTNGTDYHYVAKLLRNAAELADKRPEKT